MNKYTVIAHEEFEGYVFAEHIEAPDPYEAMKIFTRERSAPETTVIVSIIEGHHKNIMPSNGSIYCKDLEEE